MGTVSKINLCTSSGSTADTFGSWTNVTDYVSSTTEALLDFSDGTDTGWDVTITSGGGGGGANGVNAVGTGDAAWVDEAIVSAQYHLATGGSNPVYEISGLDNAKTYTIKAFGSRDAGVPRDTDYTVDAFVSFINVEAAGNSTLIALFEDISPSSGIISVSARNGSGSFGYINAIEIEEFTGGGITNPKGIFGMPLSRPLRGPM